MALPHEGRQRLDHSAGKAGPAARPLPSRSSGRGRAHLKRLQYCLGEMMVGSLPLPPRMPLDLTQVSSCLSQVYCLQGQGSEGRFEGCEMEGSGQFGGPGSLEGRLSTLRHVTGQRRGR